MNEPAMATTASTLNPSENASILAIHAHVIHELVDAGFSRESIVTAVTSGDLSKLVSARRVHNCEWP